MSTRIRLRLWQSEALELFRERQRPDFLAVATPGAGKTTFALAAAVSHLRTDRNARVIVVAPTSHLKTQWAAAANQFRIHLDPDWNPRDGAPPRDMHGIVTTYQQVATSAPALRALATDAFVVFDEIHHAGDDRAWGSSLLHAFEHAGRRLSLSGTPFRSDTSPIPFVEYHLDEARPDYEYGYGEALADRRVVRPVFFPRIDGFMEWVAADGETWTATFADELDRERANQRLRTALSLDGDWLPTVLGQAHEQLMRIRSVHPQAGGLVIAMDQEHAHGIAALLEKRFRTRAVVAVSDDPRASAKIQAFADGTEPWIVAVRMVSEGVDIPRLRIGVFATNTTTELFFRQAVGRLVRWTRGVPRQRAYFLLPNDPRLALFASRMAEQRRHNLHKKSKDEDGLGPAAEFDDGEGSGAGDGPEEQMSLFEVIGSVAIEVPEHGPTLFDDRHHDDDDADDDEAGGGELELELAAPPPPGRTESAASEPHGLPGETAAQTKRRLRDRNAEAARELARDKKMEHAQVNRELNRRVGLVRIGDATTTQLAQRLDEANKWLRQRT